MCFPRFGKRVLHLFFYLINAAKIRIVHDKYVLKHKIMHFLLVFL
ncbi:hypothetical protein BACCELL_03682 [Bacteroides cellulosilyticus DSM 14838]|uniref:Uncharacterized protein n=1 Tax=Bacteroides cellulosilyticus DSM 14838 TaxID=537012 RepID=E2NHA6_9BACE|nr:hypothetical protein BACCELL_03682 [Bacteroides cellulosilyticus DSM 14838]